MSDVIAFVKEVGFPIAVAVFVLWRLNGRIERLTVAVVKLTERLERLLDSHSH